jgi:phosphopantothenate---cysteine ligase (CTP)
MKSGVIFKMKQLEVLITSGGTISKIDDVRHIGNFSSGTTGAVIAEEFLRQGHKVHYFHATNAKRPFRRDMALDPLINFEEESTRLKNLYLDFSKYQDFLEEYPFSTFQEYRDSLKGILTEKPINVVILAAAVSDYSSEKTNGKISSDRDELVVKLSRNPKIISLVKKWNPDVFQVGFKLLANVELVHLLSTAYEHGRLNHSDLTIANSLDKRDFMRPKTFIMTPEGDVFPAKRYELANKLYGILSKRVGHLFL